MNNFLEVFNIFLIKRKANEDWKQVKRLKWREEGRSNRDIERQLRKYKVKLPKLVMDFLIGLVCGALIIGAIIYKMLNS